MATAHAAVAKEAQTVNRAIRAEALKDNEGYPEWVPISKISRSKTVHFSRKQKGFFTNLDRCRSTRIDPILMVQILVSYESA